MSTDTLTRAERAYRDAEVAAEMRRGLTPMSTERELAFETRAAEKHQRYLDGYKSDAEHLKQKLSGASGPLWWTTFDQLGLVTRSAVVQSHQLRYARRRIEELKSVEQPAIQQTLAAAE